MSNENTSKHLRSIALSRLGLEKRALPPGVETQVDQLLILLINNDTATRAAAAHALGKLGNRAPIVPLVGALHDVSDLVRAAAAQALGALGEQMPIEPLLQVSHDSSWRVRAAAVLSLGKAGKHAPIAVLADFIDDEDESVCIAAVQALGAMGEQAPIEPLTLALHDQGWSVREAAVLALEKIGGREAQRLLEEALQDKDAMVREAAIQALRRKVTTPETLFVPRSQPVLDKTIPLRPQPRQRPARQALSRRTLTGIVAAAVAACLVLASSAIVPRLFPAASPAQQSFGSASFASSATNIFSQRNGLSGVGDELSVDLHSLQAPAPGKSYYGWLLANPSDPQAVTIPLGKLPFQQGKISYLYKNPMQQNLLLTSSYFLVSQEDATVPPLAPSLDQAQWRYSAAISLVPNKSDTTHHYSLFDHIQYLLAKDPTLEPTGLQGGVGFWLTRNVAKVGTYARNIPNIWETQDARQVRAQIVSILDYLDGVSYVKKDVSSGMPLQISQAEAPIGLLAIDPNGLLASAEAHLNAIVQSSYASATQKALATQLVTQINEINTQCEMIHQEALKLMKMTDTQLLQQSTLPQLNDLRAHASFASTGDSKIGMEGAVKVFNDIQSLASFAVVVHQHS